MQDAIITVPSAPKTTLSIDSIVYVGKDQIRRNIGKTTSFYQGVQTVDRAVVVPKSSNITITEVLPVNCLVVDTDSTVTITLNNTTSLEVRKHFMCDASGITNIRLTNSSAATDANIHITYLS